jgi:hypothetical protein
LKMRLMGREVDVPLGRALAVGLILVGLVFGAFAIDAQNGIDQIGDTNDPVLLSRVLSLQEERDAYVVCTVGFAFLGLFGFFTLVEHGYPRKLAEDQMISGARTASGVTRGLSLAGNASYLPASHGLTKEKLFVQAADGDADPPSALSDDMAIAPGRDGSSPGMLMEPPGLKLLETIEEDYGAVFSGTDIESVEGNLQVLKHSLNLFKDFHFKERDGKTILRVEYGDMLSACRSVRRDMPDTCRQVACIGCSCLLLAAARATDKVVRVEKVENSDDTVIFTLQLREW